MINNQELISINILYILYFNAPMGGLHENVYNSAKFMKKRGIHVTVMVKDGPFKEKLNKEGISTITTDFENINIDLALLEESKQFFDVIHFHPGKARHIALSFGEKYNIPLVYTVHGKWHGQLNQFIDRLSAVVSVSEGVNDYTKNSINMYHEKFHVVPNGFDTDLYNSVSKNNVSGTINIGYITRFDEDKKFILDVLKKVTDYLSRYYKRKVCIHIVGAGTLKDDFKKTTKVQLSESIHELLDRGWLQGEKLVNAYNACDIVIAPGRSAIEAMALKKPVIAVGSKNYIGLINKKTWQYGIYNNFGGIGNKSDESLDQSIENDLDTLLIVNDNIDKYGAFSYNIAQVNYKDSVIQQRLLDIYKLILNASKL